MAKNHQMGLYGGYVDRFVHDRVQTIEIRVSLKPGLQPEYNTEHEKLVLDAVIRNLGLLTKD